MDQYNWNGSYSSLTTKYAYEYLMTLFNSALSLNVMKKNPAQSLKAVLLYSKSHSNEETFNIVKAICCGLVGINAAERLLDDSNTLDQIDIDLSTKSTEMQSLHNYLLVLCSDCFCGLLKESNKALPIEEQLSIMLRERIVRESEKEKKKHIYGYMFYLNTLLYVLNANFFFIITFLNEANESYFIDFIQSFVQLGNSASSQFFLKKLSVPKALGELKALGFHILALINYDKLGSDEEEDEEIDQVINSTSFDPEIKAQLVLMKQKELNLKYKKDKDTGDNALINEDIVEEEIAEEISPYALSSQPFNETTNDETVNRGDSNDDYPNERKINCVYFDFYDKLHVELKKQKEKFEKKLSTSLEESNRRHDREMKKLEEECDNKIKKEIYNLNKRIDKLTSELNR